MTPQASCRQFALQALHVPAALVGDDPWRRLGQARQGLNEGVEAFARLKGANVSRETLRRRMARAQGGADVGRLRGEARLPLLPAQALVQSHRRVAAPIQWQIGVIGRDLPQRGQELGGVMTDSCLSAAGRLYV